MNESPREVDLLVVGAAELATATGSAALGGAALGAVQVLAGHGLAIDGGEVVAVAPDADLRARFTARHVIDAAGGTLVPGLIDAHTHPVFATTREDEFELRTRGASYLEIKAAGGGILNTVRGVRGASEEELIAHFTLRLDRFLALGTTTVEAKSGYGLTTADELKLLRAIRRAGDAHPVEVVPTFLGAHEYPPEFQDDKPGYVDLLCEEMLPEVVEEGLAEYCDIFTEATVFGLDDSRRILARAQELGLRLRLHVDQLTDLGGAELAAEFGADSADHLENVSTRGIEALGAAGVVPVICPLVSLYIRQGQEVPGRELIDMGLAPAIATDFNPGSCHTQSMHEVLTWSALRMRMSVGEALTAATLNAAASLNRAARLGTLEVGKQADVLVLDLPNHKHLVYEFGRNPVTHVVKAGRLVLERGA